MGLMYALKKMLANPGISGPDYQSYRALMTQTGTAAPVVTVLENSIGTIVWTRSGVGVYVGTLTGAFTVGKTSVIVSDPSPLVGSISAGSTANAVTVSTFNTTPAAADAILSGQVIEIRVYS